MTSVINYAKLIGWDSVAAAAVFAALYSPLAAYFLFKIIAERRRVLLIMTLFCFIRLTAFILRAIAASIESVGENLGVFIAAEILFSIGFFGLLYATYILVMDRLDLCDTLPLPIPIVGQIVKLARNRRVFRLVLVLSVALGIASVDILSNDPTSSAGSALHKASVIIFLALTVVQVLLTVFLVQAERAGKDSLQNASSLFGAKHAPFIFGIIAILLLIREVFTIATINNTSKANNEHFWYPLVALPEILCVILYTAPGLVPPKVKANPGPGSELPQYSVNQDR